MDAPHRSGCPINLTLEMLGDRWSLIVIRDLMFGNRRHRRALLTGSEEGIVNILADRLKRLVAAGLLSRADDPTHRQKAIYSLTEPAIQLVPLLAQMGAWAAAPCDARKSCLVRAELLGKRRPEIMGGCSWTSCGRCTSARAPRGRRCWRSCKPRSSGRWRHRERHPRGRPAALIGRGSTGWNRCDWGG